MAGAGNSKQFRIRYRRKHRPRMGIDLTVCCVHNTMNPAFSIHPSPPDIASGSTQASRAPRHKSGSQGTQCDWECGCEGHGIMGSQKSRK